MEISAKTGQNVTNTFQMIVTNIYRTLHGDTEQVGSKGPGSQSIHINNKSVAKADKDAAAKKGCKC